MMLKVSRWLNPRRTSALEELPTEVLVEIIKHMGWKDVLASRQVCKRLFEVSTARPLWTRLLHRLSAELMAPPILERPIDTYNGGELEQIVLRRISSEINWTSEVPPKARNVPITLHEGCEFPLLLKGGRWLLLTSSLHGYCRVYAYDLDSSLSQEPQCIIDLRDASDDPEQVWHMAADVDPDESQLTFNLCLVPLTTFGPHPTPTVESPPADIHIYRVTLNGHRMEAVFMADNIKTIRNGFRAGSSRIALRGRYLARSLTILEPISSSIEVCDWVLSDESTHFKLYITIGIPQHISLLPDGKLACVLTDGIFLYDIANLRPVPPGKLPDEPGIQPYWQHSGPDLYKRAHLSKPYPHRDATRVSVAFNGAIYGLVIPRRSNDDPWYEKLSNMDMSHTRCASLGIDKAYVQGRDGTVEIASYLWPADKCQTDDVPPLLMPVAHYRKWDAHESRVTFPLFDESSNRVFSPVYGGSCIVVDFTSK
ncbi:hypothetical protein BJ912DRAFT_1002798 [Pholiota molesta]|nr:hypothetical protein BJ912DRAFT_1002798 [Pholiota molesta]